jgi:calcineurin-like phosphoesterase family protein
MSIFFTADLHINHANIIKYCNRPFSSTNEMDEILIKNWNSKVQPTDTIYVLGDFGFAKNEYLEKVLQRLNGKKHLVFGNHDKAIRKSKILQGYFQSCSELKEIYVGDQKITLCHYPMLVWNESHRNSFMLHGHCHGTLPIDLAKKRMDVGVDPNGYSPLSFDEVKEVMDKRVFVPIDHHGMEDHD